jgi:hypothetical protein
MAKPDALDLDSPIVRALILKNATLRGEFIGTLKYFRTRVQDEQTIKTIDGRIKELENGKDLFDGITIEGYLK